MLPGLCRTSINRVTEFKKPPFRIEEKGWGEFDLNIVLTAKDRGGDHTIAHDLNFQSERYEAEHTVVSTAMETERQTQTNAFVDVPQS